MDFIWRSLGKIWRLGGGGWRWQVLWLMNPTFLVGVTGVVRNDRGEILLLRHRFWREGSWGLPSGLAKRNETMEEAFRREVREETAFELSEPHVVRVLSGFRLRLEVHFTASIAGGELSIDRREILEAAFFAPDNLPDGLLVGHRKTVALAIRPAPAEPVSDG